MLFTYKTTTYAYREKVLTLFCKAAGALAINSAANLYQRQSQSVNDVNEVTIGVTAIAASNIANTSILNNESFLVWGANSTTAYTFTGTYNGTAAWRLNRAWKVRDNGSVGMVQLNFLPNVLVR